MTTTTAKAGMMAVAALAAVLGTGCDQGGQDTIGPRGGTITSADGRVTLEIPVGALDHEVAITIGEVDDGPRGSIAQSYEIEPRLLQLDIPATVTYDLTVTPEGTDALDLANMSADEVEMVTENATGWEPLADREADDAMGTVSASVVFFSSVGVVMR